MKTLLLTIVLSLSILALNAQEGQKTNKGFAPNEFGLNLGSTTGLGLSYRHWFDKFGIQLTGIPYKDRTDFFTSAAVTAMYSFLETKHVRVYAYLGNHYTHHKSNIDSGWSGTTYTTTEINDKWNIGIGPGFSFGTTVAFNIMAGYGVYDVTGDALILPAGEIGLYFRF